MYSHMGQSTIADDTYFEKDRRHLQLHVMMMWRMQMQMQNVAIAIATRFSFLSLFCVKDAKEPAVAPSEVGD